MSITLSQKQNSYCVYIHTNKQNGKKYIGITKQQPQKRWQNGIGYVGTYFGNAIKKYGWDAFEHEVIISGLDKDTACQLEIALIAQFKTNCRDYGYNIAEGGQTCDIEKKTGADHPNHERVKMIDPKTKEVICVFGAQSEAARVMGINRKCITKACQGKIPTYKGYIWEYADKNYEKPIHNGVGNYDHKKMRKKIKMIDIDNSEHIFESAKEVKEKLGINEVNVRRYISGLRNDATGRRWFYA